MRDDEVRGVEVEAKQVTTGEYPWPTREKYFEYFSNTYKAFYYINHESGDETYSEPDEEIFDIVRYCAGEESGCHFWYPSWYPEPPTPQVSPPVTDILETDCSVIPAVMPSRTLSATSVASLRDLPEQVELGKPYRALLSHLQQLEPNLEAWKAQHTDMLVAGEPPEVGRHPVTIDNEIPAKLAERELSSAELQFSPAPATQPKKKFHILSTLFSTAVAFVLFCVRKKRGKA